MKSRHILLIDDTPLVVSIQYTATQLCVLGAFTQDIRPFLCNKFTNMVMLFDRIKSRYQLLQTDTWFEKSKAFIKEHMYFVSEVVKFESINILDIIRERIAAGHYISGEIDIYYAPNDFAFENIHVHQLYLIYGYDDDKRLFYIAGKTLNSAFERYELSYDDYMNGIINRQDGYFTLNIIRPNHNFEMKVNLPEIYNGLYDYLNSCNQYDGAFPAESTKLNVYGVKCYRKFCDELKWIHDCFTYINPHEIYTFLEHHRYNQMRIDYLNEEGMIICDKISTEHKELLNSANKVYLSCLEYNKTLDYKMLGNIQNDISNIIQRETVILGELLNKIEQVI